MGYTELSIAGCRQRRVHACIRRTAAALSSLLILSASLAAAQEPAASSQRKWQVGFDVLAAVPVGDFAGNVEDAGGFSVSLDAALKESIFSVGGELGWMTYGDTSRTVALGALIPEVSNASVDVVTEHQMLLLHGRLRAQRQRGRWRPYVDGLVGFTDIYTTTSVEGALECTFVPEGLGAGGYPSCNVTTSANATNSRDFVLSYGGGVGVMWGFRSSRTSPKLDLAVRYHRGGEAQYLTEGAIRRSDDHVILNFSRSRTDMVIVTIGLAFGR